MTRSTARDIAARRREQRRQDYRDRLLGVEEMIRILGVSRRTWQQWRACGKGPRCHKLPNGKVVCGACEFSRWLDSLREGEGTGA